MEIKKYVLIPNSDWKNLKNGFVQRVAVMPELPVREPAKKYNVQYADQPRPQSRPNSKTIQDFINHSKKVVGKEKILPINLKRAMLLSDVFTEKRNQLKFQRAQKKIRKEMRDKENQRFVCDLENYRQGEMKNKQEQFQDKISLGKRLKDEIQELNLKKRKERIDEVNKEREEISQINNELEQEESKVKIQVTQAKQITDKMHQEDLLDKSKHEEMFRVVDVEEYKASKTQLKYIHRIDDIRKDIDKSIHIRKPPESHLPASKEIIQRYHDLPVIKKSKLEEKRDLYAKLLKQQRVQVHKHEEKELLRRKAVESDQRDIEYTRRCENIKLTNLFEQLKRCRLLDRVKEYRKIWSNQCNERKSIEEKCKQEDVNRREKLVQKIRRQDDEYVATVTTILNEYCKQDKIIAPIIRCLKNGYNS